VHRREHATGWQSSGGLGRARDAQPASAPYPLLPFLLRGRGFRASTPLARPMDPYKVLGIANRSSDGEIKKAFYKAAKKHHPDLNPGDAHAKRKFQEVTAAYEMLRDPNKRAAYDANPAQEQERQQAQQRQQQEQHGAQYGQYQQQQAQQTWNTATTDSEVLAEALTEFVEDLTEDVSDAFKDAAKGDWSSMGDMVNRRAGLIAGVVIPLFIVLRFPGLVLIALRFIPGAFIFMTRGNPQLLIGLFRMAWSATIAAAKTAREATKQSRKARLKTHGRARQRTTKRRGGGGRKDGGAA